jgi:hypothetical protein
MTCPLQDLDQCCFCERNDWSYRKSTEERELGHFKLHVLRTGRARDDCG